VGEKRVRSLKRWKPQSVQRKQSEDQSLEDISEADVRNFPMFSSEIAGHVLAVPADRGCLERPPVP
jgi:hypothetical protein